MAAPGSRKLPSLGQGCGGEIQAEAPFTRPIGQIPASSSSRGFDRVRPTARRDDARYDRIHFGRHVFCRINPRECGRDPIEPGKEGRGIAFKPRPSIAPDRTAVAGSMRLHFSEELEGDRAVLDAFDPPSKLDESRS